MMLVEVIEKRIRLQVFNQSDRRFAANVAYYLVEIATQVHLRERVFSQGTKGLTLASFTLDFR